MFLPLIIFLDTVKINSTKFSPPDFKSRLHLIVSPIGEMVGVWNVCWMSNGVVRRGHPAGVNGRPDGGGSGN